MSAKPAARPGHKPSRAEQRRAAQKRTRIIIAAVTAAVVAIALVVALTRGSGSNLPALGDAPAITSKLAGLPAATVESVGTGSASGLPGKVSATALSKDGKPEVLYIGAEYCPFCAAERWPMLIALSRFGSFSGVKMTRSSGVDVHPNTVTFSFHGATYTSQYVAFTAVETATNKLGKDGNYTKLDTPTTDQLSAYQELAPQGGIPFVDFAGRYLISGASYDPGVLAGKSGDEIAAAIADPSTAVAKGVLGAANGVTATLCKLTNNQPANVCTSPAIAAIVAKLA